LPTPTIPIVAISFSFDLFTHSMPTDRSEKLTFRQSPGIVSLLGLWRRDAAVSLDHDKDQLS
jgi:hypothetical protein